MIRLLLLLCVFFTVACSTAFAKTVAVMDFGTHPHAVTVDIDVLNAGKSANEYILQRLVQCPNLTVVDRTLAEDQIEAENLNTTGLIDPDTAKRLGEILGADYIIYGNVNDVSVSETSAKFVLGGVTVCTIKSHIIARMMEVNTGAIIAAAKGEGKSKSSFVKLKGGSVPLVSVGTAKVTQDSVHNALQLAAFQTVDILIKRLS